MISVETYHNGLFTVTCENPSERVQSFVNCIRTLLMDVSMNNAQLWDIALDRSFGWYTDSHRVSNEIAREFNIPSVIASAIIAAFSIRTRWAKNIEDVYTFLRTGTCKGLKIRVKKARELLALGWLRAKWDAIRAILNGKKIVRFAHNIIFGNDSTMATIDVWMCRIMHIVHATLSKVKGLYEDAELAVQIVAAELQMPVPVAQAFMWILVRGKAD